MAFRRTFRPLPATLSSHLGSIMLQANLRQLTLRFAITIVAALSLTASLAAGPLGQPPPPGPVRLGIAKFSTNGYGTADASVSIRAALETAFLQSGQFELVDRQHLESLLEEISFQQSGVTGSETAIGLGDLGNVQTLLFGEVGRIDAKTFTLTLRFVDVATGKVLHIEQANLPRDAKAISRGAAQLGRALAQLVPGFAPTTTVMIAAGSFAMGRDDGPADERPAHTVFVDSFAIDQTEVHRAAYALYAARAGERYDTGGSPRLPATGISWALARAYCRDQGKRLPTEAEWEWAARGAEGRRFPWGAAEPHPSMAHYAAPAPIEVDASLEGASPEGVLHLSGNVAEWVADWWDPMAYHSSAERNPAGPSRGEYRVTRGGSYADAAPSLSATARGFHTPTRGSEMIGFRCVQ